MVGVCAGAVFVCVATMFKRQPHVASAAAVAVADANTAIQSATSKDNYEIYGYYNFRYLFGRNAAAVCCVCVAPATTSSPVVCCVRVCVSMLQRRLVGGCAVHLGGRSTAVYWSGLVWSGNHRGRIAAGAAGESETENRRCRWRSRCWRLCWRRCCRRVTFLVPPVSCRNHDDDDDGDDVGGNGPK